MSRSMQEEGEQLIREGERIIQRDVQNALRERDFNMVVRRAQEGVELTLKGALKLLGVDYPKAHDVAPVFSEQVQRKRGGVDVDILERIEEVSLWLSQARAPSFYFEREYGEEDGRQAVQDAECVVTEIRRIMIGTNRTTD